jgi:hypothetical protein
MKNALPFGDPKRWAAIPLDVNPTFHSKDLAYRRVITDLGYNRDPER